jgi:hypothetical protein
MGSADARKRQSRVGGDDAVTATTGHIERGWFQHLQALEDAIAYRRARVTAPCPDCTASGHRCDDHACDLNLIADYQQTAMAAILDVPSRIDASQPGGSPLAAPTPSPPS